MKVILCSLLAISSVCFGDSLEIQNTLRKAWYGTQRLEYEPSIEFLNKFIDSPETTNIEKIHYINARRSFYYFGGQKENCQKDLSLLNEICSKDELCKKEMDDIIKNSFLHEGLHIPFIVLEIARGY